MSDSRTFADLSLSPRVVAALMIEDIVTPTAVQEAVIPDAMAGHDVLGRAQTGSGKTLAFGLPIIAKLAGEKSRIHKPRALIIVPTRELATQVQKSLEPIAHSVKLRLCTVYGGTRYDKQIAQLRRGTDIVVATPGRLQDLIDKRILETDDVEVTVLDEADHLCDLGFYPAVDQLLSLTPEGGQRMLLSATLDGDVDRLVKKHLRNPRLHELNSASASVTTMEHHVLVVGGFNDKVGAVLALVEANPRAIVFVKTREGATELRDAFARHGIEAVDLHGNLSQRVRERNLEKFTKGRAQVVVATDVAARGIHVDGVGLVVHFDPPTDPKAYLHRSGRTARAGESGAVVTIVTPRQVGSVVQMQASAKVTARHHDSRTAPNPMTAHALAKSGTTSPEVRNQREHRPGASRGYGSKPRTGSYKPAGERTYKPRGERPASSDRPRRDRTDRPRAEGGYQGRPERSSKPRTEGGYKGRTDNDFKPRSERPTGERSSYKARPTNERPSNALRTPEPTVAKKPRWSTKD